jgi:hypothetical protein
MKNITSISNDIFTVFSTVNVLAGLVIDETKGKAGVSKRIE